MSKSIITEIANKYMYEDSEYNLNLAINYNDLDLEARSKLMELIVSASDNKFNPNDENTKIQIETNLSKHPLFNINGKDLIALINI